MKAKKKQILRRLFKQSHWTKKMNFWLMALGFLIVINLIQTGLSIWFFRLIYHCVASLFFNATTQIPGV